MRLHGPTDSSGFTLVEVMVSMVVLLIIIGLMATIFNDATKAWDIGTRRVENDGAGRAVMDLISRDLAAAVADDTFGYELMNGLGLSVYGGDKSDMLFLVSLKDTNQRLGRRSADEVIYFLTHMADAKDEDTLEDRYRLIRYARPAEECYGNPNWWQDLATEVRNLKLDDLADATVIENVASFKVDAFPPAGNGSYALPLTFEVYLELMDEKDAATAQLMHDGAARFSSSDKKDFLERSVRRYSARVYPHNREGSHIVRQ